MKMYHRQFLSLVFLCLSISAVAQRTSLHGLADSPVVSQATSPATLDRPQLQALVINGFSDTSIFPLHTRVKYTTIIMLPQTEKILDWLCGDKEAWVLEADENLAYLRPAIEGVQTNINLITSSGKVFSFDVSEDSAHPQQVIDQKVIIRVPTAPSLISNSMRGDGERTVRFVAADKYQQLQGEVANIQKNAGLQIEQDRQHQAQSFHFNYKYKSSKPFYIEAIYDDGHFTYIRMTPSTEEKPALYVLRDGKPELTQYDLKDGVYIVAGLVDHGYLAAGKKRIDFIRKPQQ